MQRTEHRRPDFDAPGNVIVPAVAMSQTPADFYFMVGGMFRPGRILEIGCYRGGSLIALLQGAWPSAYTASVIDIETEHIDATRENLGATFGCPIEVHFCHAGASSEEARTWLGGRIVRHGRFDLAHIDADHTYESGWNDLRLCWEHLCGGGVLMGHDTHSGDSKHQELATAWREFAELHRPDIAWRWELPEHPGITIFGKGIWAR